MGKLRFSFCVILSLVLVTGAYGQTNRNAVVTVNTVSGFVVGVTINDGGDGYVFPPSIAFIGGNGTGAGAYCIISNEALTQIVVTNAGFGYTGTPTVIISSPTRGQNYSFTSGNSYVVVEDSSSLGSTLSQLTVECWYYRPSSQAGWSTAISKDFSPVSTSYELRFIDNKPVGTFHVDSSLPYGDLVANVQPSVQKWHHYAMQFDGTECSLWLDGAKILGSNAPGILVLNNAPLTIGRVADGAYVFRGNIDEVRISKVARYGTNFTPSVRFVPDVDTVALYHFDEGMGTMVHDDSGNGNTGTIFGAPNWSTNTPLLDVPIAGPPALHIHKAVYLTFSGLQPGAQYQLQISTNPAGLWENQGESFTASGSSMTNLNFWTVEDWNHLYFRLQQ